MIFFSKKIFYQTEAMDDEWGKQVSHFKYLNITFSNNLTWKIHIYSAIKTAGININAVLLFFYSKGAICFCSYQGFKC